MSSSIELIELKKHIAQLENTVEALKQQLVEATAVKPTTTNKHGLPIGLKIWADVDNVGRVWLRADATSYQIEKIGEQALVKGARFKSLSAAAEFFSKIKRKSGWLYWRTEEGRTLKDAYKG